MLIRCPECSVSFRVTAEQLRLAQGAVRCGNCETVFNAVTTLSKDQRENAVGHTQGGYGSVESTEDSPSGMADPDSGNPSTISAENATTNWPAGDQTDKPTSTGEEEWLSRLFDETEDNDGTPVFVVEGETPAKNQPEDDYVHGTDKVTDREKYAEYSRDPFSQFDTVRTGETATSGIPGWQNLAPTLDSREHFQNAVIPNHRLWMIGSVVLLITLFAQLAHNNRDALAAHARYGGTIRAVYSLLRIPLYPEWDLYAYEILGSEAVSGESQAGVLDIRAQLTVKGTQAVGEPLLRIVLRDRWSNLIARGVFTASEYRSDGTSVGSLLQPGNLAPISVSVENPGDAAQGYELHLCIMTRHAGLKCDLKAD